MRRALSSLPLIVLLAGCSAGSNGIVAPQPVAQPGAVTSKQAAAAKECTRVISAGSLVSQSLIINGCTANGKAIVLKTVRCHDGRVYASYGSALKGFIDGRWQAVGPGHETAAKTFSRC